ncbi:hypothetical protein [Arsenicicoccus sp. oral taxon 190]|uniref:hypothetical protein n=1 Tax=Arsenicicoccus sp. oral taxon 190 TaxID=1658671 RepID=UPI000679F82E|nr:hypothetical protein [Arsenicicoccus sp. oral taxon 190]AKT50524.1 hypothetical protein ADJ73_02935 [Arsenicicoccus sp. oral taxon 190]
MHPSAETAGPPARSFPLLRMWRQPDGRIALVYAASVGLSLLASYALLVAAPQLQEFARFGVVKRLTLPATYALVLAATVLPYAGEWWSRRPPLWWWLMAVSLGVGVMWAPLRNGAVTVVAFVQDVLLLGGFLVLFLAASQPATWSREARRLIVGTTVVGAFAALLSGFQVGPFVAVTAPGVAGLIYLGLGARRTSSWGLLLGAVGAAAVGWQLVHTPNLSMAVLGQVLACVGVLVMMLLPAPVRPAVLVLGVTGFLLALSRDGTINLIQGRFAGVQDVTLAQRGCESRAVLRALDGRFWEPLLGLGPGGTVDLRLCPDVETLVAAGRDLSAVDDVHLLPAWVLMKAGALGASWLALLLVGLLASTWAVARHRRPSGFDVVMVMAALAGLVAALPAGTNALSNPLVPIALGILWSRHGAGRGPELPPEGGSRVEARPWPRDTEGVAGG